MNHSAISITKCVDAKSPLVPFVHALLKRRKSHISHSLMTRIPVEQKETPSLGFNQVRTERRGSKLQHIIKKLALYKLTHPQL
jgi:hypothetical protein